MANSYDTADTHFLDVFERPADLLTHCIKASIAGKTTSGQRLLRVGQEGLADMANMANKQFAGKTARLASVSAQKKAARLLACQKTRRL